MSPAKSSHSQRDHSRHPLMIALWFALVSGYLVASATGFRVTAMTIVGLMIAVLIAATGRFVLGVIAGAAIVGSCIHFSTSMQFIVYVPTLAAFAFMAWFFYRTLRVGMDPLITRVARLEHPHLPPYLVDYTRTLTWAWTLCFVLLFVVALMLAPLLALDQWSHWVHGLGYVLPGVLFLGEYGYRRLRYRDVHHSSLLILIANVIKVCKELALSSVQRKAHPGSEQ